MSRIFFLRETIVNSLHSVIKQTPLTYSKCCLIVDATKKYKKRKERMKYKHNDFIYFGSYCGLFACMCMHLNCCMHRSSLCFLSCIFFISNILVASFIRRLPTLSVAASRLNFRSTMATLIDGNAISAQIRAELKTKVAVEGGWLSPDVHVLQ